MFAVYPEAGIHYWLNSDTRLSANISYMVSTEGRDYDYVLLGFSLTSLDLDTSRNEFLEPELSDEELLEWEEFRRPPPAEQSPDADF